MRNDNAEQSGDNILLVPVLTVEVELGRSGWLQCAQAEKAVKHVVSVAGQAAAVIVRGDLRGCDQSAAVVLATALWSATSITVYGRGSGLGHFLSSLRFAIAQERAWQAGGRR